jgi:tetratricopeptide (TPR) repeat protein
MPAFSRVKHDPALLKNAMVSALRGVTLIVMPMCGMTIALARPIILTLYGAKWVAAANVLVILSLYGAAFMACLLFANMLTALGRTRFLFILQLIWIGTLVPAMALGVHQDGIVGAAYAHVAVIVPVVLPSYLLALKRVTGVRLTALGKAALPAVLASSVAALAARVAGSQFSSPLAQLVAGLATGGVIYVICAGQQAAAVFAPKRIAEPILRRYSSAARLVGLPKDSRAKHSAKPASGHSAEAFDETGPQGRPVVAGQVGPRGADGLEDLMSRANHVNDYSQMGWLAVAVAMHEDTLADREQRLGPDHPRTITCRASLAYVYRQAGWLDRAIPLYERIFADWKSLLGPDHPRTLRFSNYLASAYCDAGRLAEAIPLYEGTFAARRHLLGPDHPSTLRSGGYLARAYRQAGRVEEAIPLYEQTLVGWRMLLGPDDLSTLRSSNYLARAYREVGRLVEAMLLCEEALERCTRVLGNDHALTRKVQRNLSMTRELTNRRHHLNPPGLGRQDRHERHPESSNSRQETV